MTANHGPEVLVVGDILMDSQYWVREYPQAGGDEAILASAQNSGGSAANSAIALAAQGVACAFRGRVGTDELGARLKAQLAQVGLDLSCLDEFGETGYTVTMIDPSGERTMFSYRDTGGYVPKLTPTLQTTLQGVKVCYISGYLLLEPQQAAFATQVAKTAKQAGATVMMDPSPTIGQVPAETLEAFLRHTDVLLPNRAELLAMAGGGQPEEAVQAMLQKVPCLAVKLGKAGSRLAARPGLPLANGEVTAAPVDCTVAAKQITPVDTTGAGDSFNAGFIAAFLQGGPPQGWLAEGNRLAAKTIACQGAVSCYLQP